MSSFAVTGNPPFARFDTRFSWVREKSGRPGDHLQLTLLSDLKVPAVGDDFILTEAIGTRGADSLSGERLQLWGRGGTLLATSEQLCWYR